MAKKATRKPKASPAQRSAPKRKASSRSSPQGKGNPRGSGLTVKNPDAASIDVGARVHYVAVPEGRAEPSVRSFGAYTAQLEELVQWLKSCGITTVAMESTGVYWIALYQKLEAAGLRCCWSMRGKPSTCRAVKATCKIVAGCSSYTVTGCCAC